MKFYNFDIIPLFKADNDRKAEIGGICSARISLLLSLFVFIILVNLFPIQFSINDDTAIQGILSGSISGTPSGYTRFSNILLCQPLAFLYSIVPIETPIWLYLLELFQFLSLFAFCYTTLQLMHSPQPRLTKPKTLVLPLLIAASGGALFFYPIVRPSFTLAAASLSASSVLFFCTGLFLKEASLRKTSAYFLLSGLYTCFAFCVRFQAGLISIVFLTCICVTNIAMSSRSTRSIQCEFRYANRLSVVTICFIMLICGVAFLVNDFAYSSEEWTEFRQLNEARAQYMDYPHDSYADNPALFQSVGWDENLYTLVKNWFFLDERINTDAFSTLASEGSSGDTSKNLVEIFLKRQDAFASTMLSMLLASFFSLVVFVLLYRKPRKSSFYFTSVGIILLIGSFSYLALISRIPLRSAICAMFPALSLMISLFLSNSQTTEMALDNPNKYESIVRAASASASVVVTLLVLKNSQSVECTFFLLPLFVAILPLRVSYSTEPHIFSSVMLIPILAFSVGIASQVDIDKTSAAVDNRNAQMHEICEYGRTNPDYFIVYPCTISTTDPYSITPENVTSWGGWTYYLPSKEPFFDNAGFPDGLYGSAFLNNDVFLASPNESDAQLLGEYLSNRIGSQVVYQPVENLANNVVVYAFHK